MQAAISRRRPQALSIETDAALRGSVRLRLGKTWCSQNITHPPQALTLVARNVSWAREYPFGHRAAYWRGFSKIGAIVSSHWS